MTQSEIDRSVSIALGESLRLIRRCGFSLADPAEVHFDPEPCQRRPQIVDWDQLDGSAPVCFRDGRRCQRMSC